MKLNLALSELHRSETHLARSLSGLAARHHADHEIANIAGGVLLRWSESHLSDLATAAADHGVQLKTEPRTEARATTAQEKLSELLGRRPEPAMLLLVDLRRLYRTAAGVSLDWELLAQGAQALDLPDLVALAKRCHPETLRQVRWANAMLKILSPQVLAS